MTPLERYQADLAKAGFVHDAAQESAVRRLDELYTRLAAQPERPPEGRWLARIVGRRRAAEPAGVRGLYLYGGVGRGKTYLVDNFYAALPPGAARRVHFHAFMRDVHQALRELRDTADPLRVVARRFAGEFAVLCLDEFHVSDITDAMILGNLLEALFELGVVLVTTSNERPDQLYRDGLQRERFLPAIAMLEEKLEVIAVDGATDYRLRALQRAEIYHAPLDDEADASLARSFAEIAPESGRADEVIDVGGRPIRSRLHADSICWFDFTEICGGPRSVHDYIEIARCYQTVLISGIPRLDDLSNDAARRFINLVDEFYDRRVNLICSAAAPPDQLYKGRKLARPFLRTVSRLVEMQSHEYLAGGHVSE